MIQVRGYPFTDNPERNGVGKNLKVITYNINRGLSAFKKRHALAAIVKVLLESGAGLACLQEVWEEEGISENALETLTRRAWNNWIYNRNAVFPGGAQGNAVLSRHKVMHWNNVDVSMERTEPRGFLDVRVRIEGTPMELAVICLHFGLKETERRVQVGRLLDYISCRTGKDDPVIVAGDFNDWRGVTHRRLKGESDLTIAGPAGGSCLARTFPSLFPMFPLDRIYYKNLELVRAGVPCGIGRRGLSDHLPVMAEFRIDR